MVANPANTNALILKENAPKIPNENITCLTRLDHNRALGQIAERAKVPVTDVKNVTIWGNHSSSQYPDVNHGTVKGKPIREVIGDDDYLNKEFIETVQQRGAAIIKVTEPAGKHSPLVVQLELTLRGVCLGVRGESGCICLPQGDF